MLCKKGSPSLLQSWVQVIIQFVQIYVIKIVVTVTPKSLKYTLEWKMFLLKPLKTLLYIFIKFEF